MDWFLAGLAPVAVGSSPTTDAHATKSPHPSPALPWELSTPLHQITQQAWGWLWRLRLMNCTLQQGRREERHSAM